MKQIYNHAYMVDELSAKIEIEWSAPDGFSQERWEAACAEAEKLMGEIYKRTHDIVGKMTD